MHGVEFSGHSSEPAQFNIHQIESLPITASQLAQATRTDKVLSVVYKHIVKGWLSQVEKDLNTFFAKREELTLDGSCILWGTRVVIPEIMKLKLLDELHHEHPGASKMKSVAHSYFW